MGISGVANTGNGGGGSSGVNSSTDQGGAGGSGIVIVRYKYDTSIPIPLMLSGCQLWFDANDGPKDGSGNTPSSGGSITTWLDRSGNNRHAITGSSPTYITGVLNSKPVVRFSSSQYLTYSSYSPGNIPMTYVMVERNLSGSTGAAPFSWGSTSSRSSGIVFQNNSGMQPFSPQAFNNTSGRYWIYRQNNTGSGDDGLMNGTSLTPTANDTGNIAAPFDIGRRNASGIYCAGDLAEIIVYNRAITDNERSLLASYLHNKYAL